jgi:hypothetical protein
MKEKIMQEIIINYPTDVFKEEGMRYIGREIKTGQRRLDIVFKDRFERFVLVEAQAGSLDTKHIDRHIDYSDGFLRDNPDADIRLIYVAFRIDPNRKRFLERRGYEYLEIPQLRFQEIAKKHGMLKENEMSNEANTDSLKHPIPKNRDRKAFNFGQKREETNQEKWDHSSIDTQSGKIDSLVKAGLLSINKIVSEYQNRFGEAIDNGRVRRHLKHFDKHHPDFPYVLDSDGVLTPKS